VVNRGSVALVTGSASGIGFATIGLAAELGYIPVGFDLARRRPDDRPASTAGGRIVHVDVTDTSAIRTAVDDVERTVGPVRLAVGAAGVLVERPFASVDEELWNETLEVHLRGIYNLTVAVIPAMAERRDGSIVTLSSELAFLGAEEHVHYVAAKAAVVGFTRAAARELAPDGIRVNCVAPGPTDTPLLGPSGRDVGYVQTIALGRLGRPEEIARAILDVARWPWTTGQLYGINGGAVIR
jgi:2-hydroxycyclohexanecarboxyl-CoA dehydrogenase